MDPVCSTVWIACFYLVSAQFNPLQFWKASQKQKWEEG